MKLRILVSLVPLLLVNAVADAVAPRNLSHSMRNDPVSWVQGIIFDVTDGSSFTLVDGTIVTTTAATAYEGVTAFAELVPGDVVEAGGRWQQNGSVVFEAELVRWLRGADEPTLLFGTVDTLEPPLGFSLNDGSHVVVDSWTDFVNLNGLAELDRGDLVEVRGRWQGELFFADWVKRLGEGFTVTVREGRVAFATPPDRFSLDDGTVVLVDENTEWIHATEVADLTAGDTVRVEGLYDAFSGVLEADWVQRLSFADELSVAFQGIVVSVEAPDRVILEDGPELIVNAETALEGFAAVSDLMAGDRLWVEGRSTDWSMVYEAVRIQLLDRSSSYVKFVSVVYEVFSDDWFTTMDGHMVRVDALTSFLGFSYLEDLQPGYTVWVAGIVSDNPLDVTAEMVELVKGEDESGDQHDSGGGLVTESTGVITDLKAPLLFMLDDWYWVTADTDTEWSGGLTGYDDLVEGLVVSVTFVFGDGLEAISVQGIGSEPNSRRTLRGEIDHIDEYGNLRLAGGEWLSLSGQTVIDGDVDDADEIVVGMRVEADTVDLGDDHFQVLSMLVVNTEEWSNPWSSPGMELMADEALVVLADGVDPHVVANRYGASVEGTLPGVLVHLFKWGDPDGTGHVEELMDDAEVLDVSPNYHFADPESIRRRFPVVDRASSSFRYSNQEATETLQLKSAVERSTGRGTVVAVIDTGVDPLHPLLRHRVAPFGWDFVDDDPWPWETADGIDQDQDLDVDESAGHGTFVAGMVLLAAPGTTILPYRVLDDDGHGTTFNICRAVLSAMDRGADVINLSFAYPQRPRVLDRILDEASKRGIVLVSGAGNDGSSTLPFPASDHRVLAVAAVDQENQLWSFSNHGAECSVAAPGVDLYSGCADGQFCTWSGTSMAAPLVSGTAALLRSLNPRLTPEQIRDAIVQSARPITSDPSEPGLLQVGDAVNLIPAVP